MKIFPIVKKVIDEWNPYCLLPEAPDDEFDGESLRVAERISAESSIESIAKTLSDVFSNAFEPESFGYEDCYPVAQKIKEAIENN